MVGVLIMAVAAGSCTSNIGNSSIVVRTVVIKAALSVTTTAAVGLLTAAAIAEIVLIV